MARVVLPVVGAVIGYVVSGFNPVGAQYGWLAGSIAGAIVGNQTRSRVRVAESGPQTTTEGAPRAIIWGACIVTGNLIDTGPIRIEETTEEAKGGGGASSTTKTYHRTYAIRICEGPIGAVLVVKRDGKVVYDKRTGSDMADANALFEDATTFYLGDETQLPDPDLEAIHGVGEVPAYRGTAYVVIRDELTARQGSVPQWEFVVAKEVEADELTLSAVDAVTVFGQFGGGDANDHSINGEFDDSPFGGNSTTFLASFFFEDPIAPPYSLSLYVQIAGDIAWSKDIVITTDHIEAVQINHALDSTQVFIGWTGNYSGQFDIGLRALAGGGDPYEPINPAGPGETVLVERDDPTYGVIQNSGGLKYARYSSLWRTDPDYTPDTLTPLASLLSDIVADIHDRCGASVPDVSELDDEVAGIVFASADYNGADAIETLRAPYFFDRAEYDGQIHYPKRGAEPVATIDFDDLVEVPDESQRESHPEYPRKLHLGYQAVQVNYEVAQATSDRYSPDARVIGEQSLAVPVVLDEEQAANLVARLHKVAWADAEGEVKFSLPLSWIGLTPSECVNLSLRGRTRRLRIETIDDSEGVRALTCRVDRQSAYTAEAPSFIPLPTPPDPPSTDPGDTLLAVLDIPVLRDVDDVLLHYVAGSSESTAWAGFQLQRSTDDGETFEAVQTFGTAAVIGSLIDDVPSASEFYTDSTNTVRVQLLRTGQTLSSISDLGFVQRGGAFALEKADGSWEIMQYRDAVDEGAGVFALTTLHRGQLNSGPSAHLPGARFVLLQGVRAVAAEAAWLGEDIVHRAPSIGQSPEDADEQTAEFVGRSQIEWPVASLVLTRDGSDISATWAPRHRLGSDVTPIASVNHEGYRVTLDDGVLPAVTFDVTLPTFTYDASALGTPVDVTVQSINRITGAGPGTTDSV